MDSSVALARLEISRPVTTRAACLPESEQSAHLNGCVPLSHQVAGHKYGVDKVGQYIFIVLFTGMSRNPVLSSFYNSCFIFVDFLYSINSVYM